MFSGKSCISKIEVGDILVIRTDSNNMMTTSHFYGVSEFPVLQLINGSPQVKSKYYNMIGPACGKLVKIKKKRCDNPNINPASPL